MADSFQDYLNSPVGGGGPTPQGGPSPTPTPSGPSLGPGPANPFRVMNAVENLTGPWMYGARNAVDMSRLQSPKPFQLPPDIFPRPHVYSDGPLRSPFMPGNLPSGLPATAPTMPPWGPLAPELLQGGRYIPYQSLGGVSGLNKYGVAPPPQGGWTYPTLNDFPFPKRQSGPY